MTTIRSDMPASFRLLRRVDVRALLGLLCVLATPAGACAQRAAVGAQAQQAAAGVPEGVLRPGDVVRLQIWREESLSGEFPVARDGTVVLPRIGSWDVTSEEPDVLRGRMLEAFQKYLRNPSIEITFLRRVTVLGAVREAGVKHIDPTMTVAEALALAGGVTPEGATDRIVLLRGEEAIQVLRRHLRIADTPLQSGDQLFVPERGWASRHQGIIGALISGVLGMAVAFIVSS